MNLESLKGATTAVSLPHGQTVDVAWREVAVPALLIAARLCAAKVAHRLPAGTAPVVLEWLATGDPSLVEAAWAAAWAARAAARAEEEAEEEAEEAAKAAAWAARAAARAARAMEEAATRAARAAATRASLSAGASPDLPSPLYHHLRGLALWQIRPCQSLNAALVADRLWGNDPDLSLGWPGLEAWRRVALCEAPAEVVQELEGFGWVREPVADLGEEMFA